MRPSSRLPRRTLALQSLAETQFGHVDSLITCRDPLWPCRDPLATMLLLGIYGSDHTPNHGKIQAMKSPRQAMRGETSLQS